MPHYLETLLYGPSRKVDHVRCLTFGDTPHVFFMNYKDIHGMTQFGRCPPNRIVSYFPLWRVWTDGHQVYHGLPQKLVDWIETPQNQIFQRDHSLRVELGLNGSFFAWDRTTYRWAGLPEMLEDTIQDWIRVGGWIEGPPELVSLGYGDSFYIRTDRKSAYRANMSQEQEPALFFKWQDYHRTGADPKIFHVSWTPSWQRFYLLLVTELCLLLLSSYASTSTLRTNLLPWTQGGSSIALCPMPSETT